MILIIFSIILPIFATDSLEFGADHLKFAAEHSKFPMTSIYYCLFFIIKLINTIKKLR